MLEFKGQAPIQVSLSEESRAEGSAISEANLLRIETSRGLAAGSDSFSDRGLFGALAAFFSAAWSTDRAVLQPIPVKARDRR